MRSSAFLFCFIALACGSKLLSLFMNGRMPHILCGRR
jgi:hypothetical protein